MSTGGLSGCRVGCISTSRWDGLWTRKQWLMRALSQDNDVLYLDPQESFTYRWRCRGQRRGLKSVARPPRLRVLTPWPAVPFGQDQWWARLLNDALLLAQLRLHVSRAPDVWWVYDPVAFQVVRHYPARLVVYDCVDRHSAYGGYRRLMERFEQRLLQRADVVFVTARGLVEHCARYAPRVYYVSNGFDEDLFRTLPPPSPRLRGIPRPRLGFIGGLGHWFNAPLLQEVAEARPDWSIVLVGPRGDLDRLPRAPNIHWLGPCAREEVPAFAAGFDVGIIPFTSTDLTKTVNPLKAYEYLAAGLPVVSTRLPELDHLPLIRQVSSSREFVDAVECSLRDTDEETRALRRAAAAPFSLQRGLATMKTIVGELWQRVR